MKRSLYMILLLAITIQTFAYDFKVDDLCYNITSDSEPYTVGVTNAPDNYYLLTEVKIPDTVYYNGKSYIVTEVGREAFKASPLTSVTIPNSVKYLRYNSFAYCSSLSSIIIPKSVEEIQSAAFMGCDALKVVTIENGLKKISNDVFHGCSALSSIIIPNTVTTIGEYAFRGCESLSSITLSDSLQSIERYTFMYCPSLTSITIPNSVTSIGTRAFEDCSSLTAITIPNSVIYIGSRAFDGCSALTVPLYNANCFAYMPISYSGAYSIPEGIKQIAGGAFADCFDLTSITIPNSVNTIGSSAFIGCSSLTTITIPNGITSIEGNIFDSCSSLSSITIGCNVTNIQNSAFNRCPSLSSIVWNAKNCADASRYNFAPFYYIQSQITSFTLGDSVKNIPAYLCYGMSKLTSMTIPHSVTKIGSDAFHGCTGLTSITSLAETPPSCSDYTFWGVNESIPIYVPCEKVTTYQATYGWDRFTNIQEPLADYSITVNVKDNNMGSAKVDFNTFCEGSQISATANYGHHFVKWSNGSADNPYTLELTQDTILTAEFALSYSGQCGDNLYWQYTGTTLAITGTGNMWEDIPWRLFIDSITTVNIANGATSISESSFANCKKLNKLILPASIEEIGANAFSGCRMLYDIYCFATLPPMADASSFTNYNAYLYVPCEAQRYYKADMVFSKFLNTECISSDNVETEVVVVTPGSTDVTITWPTDSYAETYVIVIEQGDKVFCTLTFDADGRLLNIAFAPSRSNNHPAMNAGSTGSGLRFTITNLEEGTTYEYNIITKDGEDKVISTYTGEFTTKGNVATTVSDVQHPITDDKKILRNGQFLIFHDGKTYNAQGTLVGNN